MLNSVVIEIGDEYVDNDLIYLSDEGLFGLTQLGGYYGIALLLAMKKMDEGYTPLEPIEYSKYTKDVFTTKGDKLYLTRSGIDWTVQYIADNKFNQFVYEVARGIFEQNIKDNV